ncbi:MAG: protein phosphatase 2C domain-containing protein [Acidobacteriia bacterium]|nr:protein phosphatase 2C domain-containing protein [Terriglobia bacterium]
MSTVGEASIADEPAITINVFGMSDVGRVRKNNEDSFVICNLSTGEVSLTPALRSHVLGPRGTLFLVADGMGGEASGEVASQICATTVPKRLYENLKSLGSVSETNFVLLLREAVEFANQIIFQKALAEPVLRGMGTTTTAAALFGPRLFVAQVGDSRAYLLRDQQMVQLTRDQTYLNYLAEIGAELPQDPEKDSRRSILTQAVGSSETVDVKVTYTDIRQGDRLLLCSDGLYNMVKLPDLASVLTQPDALPAKCKTLIDKANEKGGTDNITVIIAEISGPGLPPPDAQVAVEFREFREGGSETRA